MYIYIIILYSAKKERRCYDDLPAGSRSMCGFRNHRRLERVFGTSCFASIFFKWLGNQESFEFKHLLPVASGAVSHGERASTNQKSWLKESLALQDHLGICSLTLDLGAGHVCLDENGHYVAFGLVMQCWKLVRGRLFFLLFLTWWLCQYLRL